ncbi:MAG: Holliday junction resolvase RecU [Romboutsia sp.]
MTKQNTANRGLKFEEEIQRRCDKLRQQGIALISKVPTDWKVLRKFNPKAHRTEIFGAFPVAESKFVDFVGIINGQALGMEAKETKNKTNFPFSNIKETQIDFLTEWVKLGGLGYYIIKFKEHEQVFLVPSEIMHDCIKNIGRKSAPYQWFLDNESVIELDYKKLNFDEYIRKGDVFEEINN